MKSIFAMFSACFNFMNLSTAQASRRAKEVGMRKVLGAHRQLLIRQFLGFDKERIVSLPTSQRVREQFLAVRDQLLSEPGITDVTISSRVPSGRLLDSRSGQRSRIRSRLFATSSEKPPNEPRRFGKYRLLKLSNALSIPTFLR